MSTLLHDLRYAVRVWSRAPGLTAVALLTLAVGTGANATVFGFVNALLLRPAPGVSDPAGLVSVYTSDFSSTAYGTSSYPDYLSIRDDATAFGALAAYDQSGVALLATDDAAERVRVGGASGPLFAVLGLRAGTGRLLGSTDSEPGAPPAAVISHDLWQRAFTGRADVAGQVLRIDAERYTIAGVLPQGFTGLDLGRTLDVWVPLEPRLAAPTDRGNRGLAIVGRLAPGVSLREANAQLATIADGLARTFPDTNMGTLAARDRPRPMAALPHSRIHPDFRGEVAMLGGVMLLAVALVLLVACANVASLLLARATGRGREIAVRLALGAAPRRLVRQLLTESAALGLAGGTLGLVLSLWTADALPSFFPPEQARMLTAQPDVRAFFFILTISLASGLALGLAPALHAVRHRPAHVLRDGSGTVSGRGSGRVRAALVGAQMALACVLLVAASLLVQTALNTWHADLGFSTRHALLVSVEVPSTAGTPPPAQAARALVDRLTTLAGVEAAGVTTRLPLAGGARRGFVPEGYERREGEDLELPFAMVDAAYFDALGLPLVAGRTFTPEEDTDARPVVVVNDVLAQRYFEGAAVGRRIIDSGGQVLEVVGQVGATPLISAQSPPTPIVYHPIGHLAAPRFSVIVRTAGEPLALAAAVRSAVADVSRDAAAFRIVDLEGQIAEAATAERLTATLVGVSGLMALLLAAVGTYGLMTYGVAQRSREIALRIVLGARPRQVLRLVLADGLRVTLGGIVVGVGAALATAPLLGSMLFGVAPVDPLTLVGAPALLAIVAALATWYPARRALAMDPAAALRQE